MRVLTIALVVGAAIIGYSSHANNKSFEASLPKPESTNDHLVSIPAKANIDTVVTGRTLPEEHLKKWKALNKAHLECPKCKKRQLFTGD